MNNQILKREEKVKTLRDKYPTKKNVLLAGFFHRLLSVQSESEDIENYLGLTTLASIPDRKDYITGKGPRNSSKTTSKKKKKRRKK